MPDSGIINDKARRRFYIPVDNKEAFLKYRMRNENTIEYITTFVPEEFRGEPYSRELVEYALNYARVNNLRVVPSCSYVKNFLNRNAEEYKDIEIEK